MGQKVINIKRATRDPHKPLVSMDPAELRETMMEVSAPLDEGILSDARAGKAEPIRLVATVLTTWSGEDRIVCAYAEYGDEAYVDLCRQIRTESARFLHDGESLRIVTYEVLLDLTRAFKFPSLRTLEREKNEGRRRYGMVYEARGMITVIVTWLVTGGTRRLHSFDVDHGDGCGMHESALETIASTRHNKLLGRDERLEAIAYDVPFAALREVVR